MLNVSIIICQCGGGDGGVGGVVGGSSWWIGVVWLVEVVA